jgi:hypothetical protein
VKVAAEIQGNFKSLDEFMALRFMATVATPAARRTRILLMNQPIMFGMR